MFEKVRGEKSLRKLGIIGRDLLDTDIKLPTEKQMEDARKELEKRLSGAGRINNPYIKNVVIGFNYAQTHCNNKGKTLLEKINEGCRIYLSSFLISSY